MSILSPMAWIDGVISSPSVWHVPPNYKGNLLLPKLLYGNLQGIRLALEVHENRRVHAVFFFFFFLRTGQLAFPCLRPRRTAQHAWSVRDPTARLT